MTHNVKINIDLKGLTMLHKIAALADELTISKCQHLKSSVILNVQDLNPRFMLGSDAVSAGQQTSSEGSSKVFSL